MKKTLKIFFSLLLILFLVLATFIMVNGFIAYKKNEPLFVFSYGYATVKTGSMQVEGDSDSLHVGDVVIYKKLKYEELKVNDIIIFKQFNESLNKDILIVHRIIAINDDGTLITKGDSNNNPDDPIDRSNFKAIVVSKFSFLNVGKIVLEYRNYLFIIILAVGLISISYETVGLIKTVNKRNKEKILLKKMIELENYKEDLVRKANELK